jgi:hypothetical protein
MLGAVNGVDYANELSTLSGFSRRVRVERPANTAAAAMFAVAILAFAWNIFNAIRQVQKQPGTNFFVIVFSTHGRTALESALFAVLVYSPPILVALAILVGLYARKTARRVIEKSFNAFQQRGYVASQFPIGMLVKLSRDKNLKRVVLLSHPSVTDETYASNLNTIREVVSSIDAKAAKKLSKVAVRAGV